MVQLFIKDIIMDITHFMLYVYVVHFGFNSFQGIQLNVTTNPIIFHQRVIIDCTTITRHFKYSAWTKTSANGVLERIAAKNVSYNLHKYQALVRIVDEFVSYSLTINDLSLDDLQFGYKCDINFESIEEKLSYNKTNVIALPEDADIKTNHSYEYEENKMHINITMKETFPLPSCYLDSNIFNGTEEIDTTIIGRPNPFYTIQKSYIASPVECIGSFRMFCSFLSGITFNTSFIFFDLCKEYATTPEVTKDIHITFKTLTCNIKVLKLHHIPTCSIFLSDQNVTGDARTNVLPRWTMFQYQLNLNVKITETTCKGNLRIWCFVEQTQILSVNENYDKCDSASPENVTDILLRLGITVGTLSFVLASVWVIFCCRHRC